MDDADKTKVAEMVKGWKNVVSRGDCTREYAATEIAATITYPYATAARFEMLREAARKMLPRGR